MSAAINPRLARFEICRVRRGSVVERFQPALDRDVREEVSLLVAQMKNDARRWGDSIRVVRAGHAA